MSVDTSLLGPRSPTTSRLITRVHVLYAVLWNLSDSAEERVYLWWIQSASVIVQQPPIADNFYVGMLMLRYSCTDLIFGLICGRPVGQKWPTV